MAMTFASVGFGKLNVDKKLALVGQLWDDLVASAPPGSLLTEAQKEELRRRVVDAAARPHDWLAWEEVLGATVRKLSG
jgi:putative addiction module component (TIGR02574 family)